MEFDFTQNDPAGPKKLPALTKVLEEDGLLNQPNTESQPESTAKMPEKPLAKRGSPGPSSLYSINFNEHHVMDTERNAFNNNPRLNEQVPDTRTSAGKQSNALMFATGALKSDRIYL